MAGVLLGLIGLAGIGGMIYVYLFLVDRTEYDEATLCPVDGPVAHLAILLDMTDPVAPAQIASARSFIEDEIDAARPGTMISVSLVEAESGRRGDPKIMLCKPKSGDEAHALYENERQIRRRYLEKFQEPFDERLDAMLSAGESPSSPIMESLQGLVAFTPGFRTFDGPRKLVIFSDLMQHSDALSVYRGMDWDDLQRAGGERRLARSLADAEILLLRASRPRKARVDVDDLWARYFDAQGAGRVRVRSIGDL